MPQLDKLTIISQIFWLSLFFFALYFFALYFFTSITYKSLKLYNIMNKNSYQLIKKTAPNNVNIYAFYIYVVYSFFNKELKITQISKFKKTPAFLCDTSFIFDYPYETLYFYNLASTLAINEKIYHEI